MTMGSPCGMSSNVKVAWLKVLPAVAVRVKSPGVNRVASMSFTSKDPP